MRVLILGGTGFTGPEQVEYAIARGHRVTLFNRNKTLVEAKAAAVKDLQAAEDDLQVLVVDPGQQGFVGARIEVAHEPERVLQSGQGGRQSGAGDDRHDEAVVREPVQSMVHHPVRQDCRGWLRIV